MAFEIVENNENGINSYSVYETHDQILVMRNFLKLPTYGEAMIEFEKAQNWDEQWEIAACDYYPETNTYRIMFDPEDQDKYEHVWIETSLLKNASVTILDVLKQIDLDGKFAKEVERQEQKYLEELKEEDSYRYMIERESLSW